jgi:hypothetical protein
MYDATKTIMAVAPRVLPYPRYSMESDKLNAMPLRINHLKAPFFSLLKPILKLVRSSV